MINSAAMPMLFCSAPAYPSDSSGTPSGGLVAIKALDSAGLASLGTHVNLPLAQVAAAKADGSPQRALTSQLGSIPITTTSTGAGKIAVDALIPTVNGAPVVVESLRDRPIHQVANQTAVKLFVLVTVATAALIVAT